MMLTKDQEEHSAELTCYASHVGNFDPINPIALAEQIGASLDEVLEFFEREFGGFEQYLSACDNREELGRQLARLNGDA